MAGYSGTPLPKKLGIKAGHLVALLDCPKDFGTALGELPEGVTLLSKLSLRSVPNVVVWFVTGRAQFVNRLNEIRQRMAPATSLWVAWPKRSSGVATDMTENEIRAVSLPTGLVDNKVCAIDEVWSALRLVVRLEHRR